MTATELQEAKAFISRYGAMTTPHILSFLKKNELIAQTQEHLVKAVVAKTTGKNSIEVDVPFLTLRSKLFTELRNIRPDNAKVDSIEISMKFGVSDDKIFSDATILVKSSCEETRYFGFHFDTLHSTTSHRFPHPSHHFQFGGENLATYGFQDDESYYGRLLFMDTPRIAFPPMDLSLVLHFLLSNFLPSDKYSVKSTPNFEQQLKTAQSRLWGPFFSVISSHWSGNQNALAKNYLPQLLG